MMIRDEVIASFKVRKTTMERMQEEARRQGEPVTAFGRRLLSMGFNLYFRAQLPMPDGNRELDEQVRLVMCLAGQADHAAISRATGVDEALVGRIFEGFSVLRSVPRVAPETSQPRQIEEASATPEQPPAEDARGGASSRQRDADPDQQALAGRTEHAGDRNGGRVDRGGRRAIRKAEPGPVPGAPVT